MYQTVFLKNKWLLLLILTTGCAAKKKNHLPYYNTPDFNPMFITPDKAESVVNHTINSFSFIDQNGAVLSDKTLERKIHITNFIFTRCGNICPVMTKNMKAVEKEFMNDTGVIILSFSVTPWIDTVQALKKYATDNDIVSSSWHLLTGSKGAIYTLARRSYFAEEDLGFTKDSTDFLHTEHVLLIDKTKRIRGIYNGTLPFETEQLIKDIKLLQQE